MRPLHLGPAGIAVHEIPLGRLIGPAEVVRLPVGCAAAGPRGPAAGLGSPLSQGPSANRQPSGRCPHRRRILRSLGRARALVGRSRCLDPRDRHPVGGRVLLGRSRGSPRAGRTRDDVDRGAPTSKDVEAGSLPSRGCCRMPLRVESEAARRVSGAWLRKSVSERSLRSVLSRLGRPRRGRPPGGDARPPPARSG